MLFSGAALARVAQGRHAGRPCVLRANLIPMNPLPKRWLARRLQMHPQAWPERAMRIGKRTQHREIEKRQTAIMIAENGTMGHPRKLHPLVAGAAVTVMISALGVAAITGILPGAMSQKSAHLAPGPVEAKTAACPSCGTIESIRSVEVQGDAGNGRGQDAMTMLGAPGAAYAGNEIEKNMKNRVVYRVTVKMDDGSFRTVSQAAAPSFAVGDKVRVVQGAIRAAKS